jgi:hypothetical protein
MTMPRHGRTCLQLMIAGILVILFSTVGVAAIRGWRPAPAGVSAKPVVPAVDAAQRRAKARAGGRCAECGLIVSIRKINRHGDVFRSGRAGEGRAERDENPPNPTTSHEIMVRMADGSSRVISDVSPASWRVGERVIVIAGTLPPQR